MYIYKPQ